MTDRHARILKMMENSASMDFDDAFDDDPTWQGLGKELEKQGYMSGNFVPHDKVLKCAHKDCNNEWTVKVTEQPPVLCCGGYAKVCPDCESQGFRVYDGTGNGRFYLTKDGKAVADYDYNTAYKITRTIEDVHNSIVEQLVEGHPPGLDYFKDDLLKEYVENEKAWKNLVKEDDVWIGIGWAERINVDLVEKGSKFSIVPMLPYICSKLAHYNKDAAYFTFGEKYIMYFDLERCDIDFVQ
jgi:hypothetical protein